MTHFELVDGFFLQVSWRVVSTLKNTDKNERTILFKLVDNTQRFLSRTVFMNLLRNPFCSFADFVINAGLFFDGTSETGRSDAN